MRSPPLRILDLDDVGALVAEELGGERARHHGGELEDGVAVEGAGHGAVYPGLRRQEQLVDPRLELGVIERDPLGSKPRFAEPAQPVGAREQTLEMAVVLDADAAVVGAHQVGVVDGVGGVVGIGIPGPFEVAQTAAPGRAVVAAVIVRRTERLAHVVGTEQRGAAGIAVQEGGLHRLAQVALGESCR